MEKRLIRVGILTMIFFGCVGLLFAGAKQETAKASQPKVVTIAIPGDVTTWNPFSRNEVISNSMQRHVFETLIYVNSDLSASPGLAVSWTPNKDARVWSQTSPRRQVS